MKMGYFLTKINNCGCACIYPHMAAFVAWEVVGLQEKHGSTSCFHSPLNPKCKQGIRACLHRRTGGQQMKAVKAPFLPCLTSHFNKEMQLLRGVHVMT